MHLLEEGGKGEGRRGKRVVGVSANEVGHMTAHMTGSTSHTTGSASHMTAHNRKY